ncbi:AlkA N-terminal domain-containing protein [Anaeromyxobacter terrae]|uniref:AlkA N-terminal domain-containing protein n=1 Tax=Anaeromyxobacter terrae TaxID=2925406 RepID=UPI001F59389F|nr:DNA-3-methyladenine glycosylase 2 [Anaeromyxobacter sp. SG22]
MNLDADTCFGALAARDPRFDGRFFVGVRTTGIYCRPVCPARTPRRDRCVFFARAAEAEREGFRACFRCRPELAPGGGPVDAVPRLVSAAASRIGEGFLNEASVDDLAAALGVTSRHLRRAVAAELGVTPIELAQSRRMALAKQLLHDTALPMAEVAFAAGFSSLRRFNALFQQRFGRAPSAIRRAHGDGAPATSLVLRLDFRPPLDWDAMLGFLAARCTARVEQVEAGAYRRTVRLGGRTGWVSVTRDPARPALRAEVSLSLAGALMPLVARLRGLFDLDARPDAVAAWLRRDPVLSRSLRRNPGLRVPGAFDGFDAAVRVVVGQQVSVAAATTVGGRLAAALGEPVATPFPGLDRLAPTPEAVAAAGVDPIARAGMPGARARTILALAESVAGGGLALHRGADGEAARAGLLELPGVGPWTAEVIAMRAVGDPDAFPAADLGVLRALGEASGRAAEARAEAWRPWRAYAVMHLWTLVAGGADI